jgi:predicted ATPase
MIRQLTIKNFKCLQNVTVDFGPLTVLIGPNDCGKSSLLDAIHVLGRTAHEPLASSLVVEDGVGAHPFDELVYRRDSSRTIAWTIRGSAAGKDFTYGLELRGGPVVEAEDLAAAGGISLSRRDASADVELRVGSNIRESYPKPADTGARVALERRRIEPIVAGFASSAKYRFDPRSLRKVSPPDAEAALSRSGDNLAAALDALLTGPDRSAVQGLEAALHEAIPTLAGVSLRTVRGDAAGPARIGKAVEFTLTGGRPPVTIPAAHASEGALLTTALLALAYGPTPEIVLLEEPEAGLHPGRLEGVVRLLRQMSTGEIGGRPRQVIVATHSPLFLNHLAPEEVRIVRRDLERGTEVTPLMSVQGLERLLDESSLGEAWVALTETGLLAREGPGGSKPAPPRTVPPPPKSR